jgi:hypothetical protein
VLQIFRNNNPFTVIILFIGTLVLKLSVLMHPQAPVAIPGYFVYNALLDVLNVLLHGSGFGYTFFNIILLFLQALYINRIAAKYKLFYRPSYIPALVFILLISLYPPYGFFSLAMAANWFVLCGVDCMLSFNQTLKPRKQIFNAGYLFCLAGILQFSAMGFVFLLLGAIIVLRTFNPGEWIVGVLGYLTPIYFFAGILFLTNNLSLLQQWPQLGFSVPVHIVIPAYTTGLLGGFIVLIAVGLYNMQLQVPKTGIYIRRNWAAITMYAIIAMLVAIFTNAFVPYAWLIAIPALTFIIAHGFNLEKNKRFSNFIFYFSLLLVIFCQVVYK